MPSSSMAAEFLKRQTKTHASSPCTHRSIHSAMSASPVALKSRLERDWAETKNKTCHMQLRVPLSNSHEHWWAASDVVLELTSHSLCTVHDGHPSGTPLLQTHPDIHAGPKAPRNTSHAEVSRTPYEQMYLERALVLGRKDRMAEKAGGGRGGSAPRNRGPACWGDWPGSSSGNSHFGACPCNSLQSPHHTIHAVLQSHF